MLKKNLVLIALGLATVRCSSPATSPDSGTASIDLKDKILTNRVSDCAGFAGSYTAQVKDVLPNRTFTEAVTITAGTTTCTLTSNAVPNHDFEDKVLFANSFAEQSQTMQLKRSPAMAATKTPLSQQVFNAVMLNGVALDLLSAGCFNGTTNVAIGCPGTSLWLLDPLSVVGSGFGTDSHNAHTQPGGHYHYHGDPKALFDASPGPDGSPVIGFAADGFPVFGSWFKDSGGTLRKATSSYQLKSGSRGTRSSTAPVNPGGDYDGLYIQDYEYLAGKGDLDECNGMTVNGEYGYYVTDSYPWVMNCFSGTPDASFRK